MNLSPYILQGWNDPDMLEVGNGGMSASEDRVKLLYSFPDIIGPFFPMVFAEGTTVDRL